MTYKFYQDSRGNYTSRIIDPKKAFKKVPYGMYNVVPSPAGIIYAPIEVKSDGLIDLPDPAYEEVMADIERFIEGEARDRYERYGYIYRRGLLLFGRPGTGKTAIINKIAQRCINIGCYVLYSPNPEYLAKYVSELRQDDNTFVLVIWEDLDIMVENMGTMYLTNIMDGAINIDNILYLTTTNFINKIPESIKRRPSRIARMIEVKELNLEARIMYIKSRIPEDSDDTVNSLAKATEGMTIDEIKDIIVNHLCLMVPLEEAVSLRKEHEE